MRVDIIGGGPAGLLLAGLLRRDGTADDVRVFERHGRDADRGWGLVFPEGALRALEQVDGAACAAVKAAGVAWSLVDIRRRSSRMLVNGNGFHGVPRAALLAILGEAAEKRGARLHFGHRVNGLEEHGEADLVVGADGVNSVVRRELEEFFEPRTRRSSSKYAWYGVDRVFPYFTYIFRETRWGLFQAYCYPSGQPWSSMIVHVSEETWHRAGLSGMDEEASAHLCEQVFAEDLRGGTVLSGGAPWSSFPYLRCARWHHRNVVLVGDAAHTAHWSIGSGTRLAIEDAVALAGALAERPGDVRGALERFAGARRGRVERFQAASRLSERYFQNLERYRDFAPMQFAYQLMVRSWRITHEEVAERDPGFVAEFDRWFHARATGRTADAAPPPALTPKRIGALTTRNRLVTEEGGDGGLAVTGPVPETGAHGSGEAGPPALPRPRREDVPTLVRLPRSVGPEECRMWAREAHGQGYASVVLDLSGESLRRLRKRPPERLLAALREETPHGHLIAAAVGVDRAGEVETAAEDAVALARTLRDWGVDVLFLEPGQGSADVSETAVRVAQICDAVRNETGMTVVADGAARTLNEANTVVAAGWADLCVLRPQSATDVEEA
ncbi:FAD-dependent monooxygenase [Thermobifida halotolerans]|uniref:FAD-dependent monooxygenase n=1 Tax=Thermobifida halotolerans TaxID=483545 RepID=A0AA97LZP9_9ACTN|nr:FAD-dependent monooxygenase [Thermobifida halotolerans]UOE21124.1 FAD-dependent monooxygenase [Thermobifida halotolerans]